MPTVLLAKGFRFFFYSNEGSEPIHVHVMKGDAAGKIWLVPTIEVSYFNGFTNKEEKQITALIVESAELFKNKWDEYFGK